MPRCPSRPTPETPQVIATEILAPLLDPAKVATLKGDRPANVRLYKFLYWLETARERGGDVSDVIGTAQAAAGKQGITWSRKKLEDFGCFTPEGMAELKIGGSPTITKGPHTAEGITLDHDLPRAVVPVLAARFYNLEAITTKENGSKGAKIGQRELELARRWRKEGLLSAAGLAAVEMAAKKPYYRLEVKYKKTICGERVMRRAPQ